ncbi:MAG: hypothetical protein QM680_02685 [Luteolibacter sp.]
MKPDQVITLTVTFEGHAQQTGDGVEYWLARDLQRLLGYTQRRNFLNTVSKAETACGVSGHQVSDHFADVSKMVDLGSGSQRQIEDLMLTRYPIAQKGDPQKQEIAFAQTYFAVQTRRAELIQRRLEEAERVSARRTLLERGIRPETLPPAEDVKKVERRLTSEEKKSLKKPDGLKRRKS